MRRAGPPAPHRPAGGAEPPQVADQQRADARRAAMLVRGQRDEVGVGGDGRVGAGGHLRGIDQQEVAGGVELFRDGGDRLADAGF